MAKTPQPKFLTLGKSKYAHVIRTEAYDRKHSECQQVRKYAVGGKINYKSKHLSAEAALALEPCPSCDTGRVAKAEIKSHETAEDRRAEAEATREKIKRESMTDGQRRKAEKKAAAKQRAEGKPKKERPKRQSKPTKSGPRSTGGSTQEKVDALAAFAKEHGWAVTTFDAEPGVRLVAKQGDQTITCFFVDGKYDAGRHASLSVGNWTGKLRGVHGCRKQMAGEGRDRPHPNPGHGRSGPRKKSEEPEVSADESPEDAARRVPFLIDDEALDIIEKVRGQIIRWRNGVSGSIEEAWLPAKVKGHKRDVISVTVHPKTGKRMLNFLTVISVTEDGEQYGPERSVYLDKIVRVVAA
jgi:hypothetical protein